LRNGYDKLDNEIYNLPNADLSDYYPSISRAIEEVKR
jgi:hypothetical protein